jgi:hypothetical protein
MISLKSLNLSSSSAVSVNSANSVVLRAKVAPKVKHNPESAAVVFALKMG